MKYYDLYMSRQEISRETHEKLLGLTPRRRSARSWARYGALAACAALIVGVGVWRLAPRPQVQPEPAQSANQFAAGYTPLPGEKDTVENSFTVSAPEDAGKRMFPYIPAIRYQDITGQPQIAASRAYAPGTFLADLPKEDIQTIFWGPEGKPEADHPKMEQGDLPWMLFWDGYTIYGRARYDGEGQLTELTIYGEKDRASFKLELCPGALPFTCCIDMSRGDEISEAFGVSVAGWSQVCNRDGDGQIDYICGSEFMTENGVGVRFENRNSLMQAEYGAAEDASHKDMDLGGACTFNSLFVRQALTGGLYLDHLMTNENIPAWREESFATLAQARQEEDFAPYLPKSAPMSNAWEFYGHLSYQEGRENVLWVRWSRGYDNVAVEVYRPGASYIDSCTPVDINVPASYDTRLYEIPWCDSVPEEYQTNFYSVTFRARDMSLEAVQARETGHDTGGSSFHFKVLHDSGAVVSYSCDGMTAEQVWALVDETL